MTFHIYDSFSREKKKFEPINSDDESKVGDTAEQN